MKRLYLSLLIAVAITVSAKAEVWGTQIEQSAGEDGAYAQFKLWIPPGSHPDRLIALTWGGNQCSLDVVNDPGWQDLAKSIGAGLLTCYYAPQTSNNQWDHAADGSGQALLDALPVLAQLSGESQLAESRLYMIGDSQGGQFSFSFAGWKPDRVLCFVSLKGGRHEASAVETASSVPGLFFAGELDLPYRVKNIEQTFVHGRAKGAPWCLVIDNEGKHEPGPCAPLICTFLQELSEAKEAATSAPLLQGNHADINPASLSWFPSGRFKSEWAAFESMKLVSSAPDLSFESKMPTSNGTTTPTSCNLGFINSGEKSQLVTVQVIPGVASQWDGLKILDRSYLADAKAVSVTSESASISFKLNTEALPLGRFSGVIPIRFVTQGKPILGGVNLPVTATVAGDVIADPAFIYLDSVPLTKTISVKLEVRSKLNETIKLLSFKTPLGISLTALSKSKGTLVITVSCTHIETDSTTAGGGMILLYLETDKKWTLRIPCIEHFEPPSN